MLRSRLCGLVLLVFTAGACGEDAVTGPAAPTETPSLNSLNGTIKKRFDLAAGAVEVDAFGLNHKYAFLAFGEPGGAAEGTWEWTGQHPDATWHASGRVLCLLITGNRAQVAGIIDQTDAYWAQPPFNYAIWTVRDMGNKKKSPPDQASLMTVAVTEAQALAHCQADAFFFTPPVTNGEVLVRPAKVKLGGDVSDDLDL